MNDDITRPTDHLPPASERAEDDDRTTAGAAYPVDSPVDEGGVSPDTAAEPGKAQRHGLDKTPPGVG